MTTTIAESEKRQRLEDLIADFHTAMLVTRTSEGGLRSRPLAIADNRGDGALYFATAVDSGKVNDLQADTQVNVSMQDKYRFVSVTGRAHIETERPLIDRLWSESWKVWFPQGKDDPSLCIVVVEPTEASYWDMTGAEGLRYWFESAKAYVKGTRPDSDNDERHVAHVKL
ncbi:MAG TPA: pyridoxamine 5'-phosphate oxidase family protein [Polyangia bacterium]|jgi:general stress protein 26